MKISLFFLATAAPCFAVPTRRPIVRLAQGTYQGFYNATFGINVWNGIRFAAAPVGNLRWKPPLPASTESEPLVQAVDPPPLCPQTGPFGLPEEYGFNSAPGDEDCLFLNVYASPNASRLPVLFWIHGGGYGMFGARYDPSAWMKANDNGFVVVEIQYRLGAFGFLAGTPMRGLAYANVGLLDQEFALEWVQEHIGQFGGDPRKVTIAGESSGAGSAMLHAMARGGAKDMELFENIIAASPYTAPVYGLDDPVPNANFDAFADLAGCGPDSSALDEFDNVMDCLASADSAVLQNASATVSETRGNWGSWAFLPVLDDSWLIRAPSDQLARGEIYGKRLLVGNNANEGVPLTNPQVETLDSFDDFVAATFSRFTPSDVSLLKEVYGVGKEEGDGGARFDTLGDQGPTALTQSDMATGVQQAAFDIVAESAFGCPAEWLAQAFSSDGRQAWKYQYSVTPSYHGADLNTYFSIGTSVPNADFQHAMQRILGQFIMTGSPVVPLTDATAGRGNASVPADGETGDVYWPAYSGSGPWQMNLNTTGGTTTLTTVTPELSYHERSGAGIVNTFRLVNASSWEGGRGARCEFWRSVGGRVPM